MLGSNGALLGCQVRDKQAAAGDDFDEPRILTSHVAPVPTPPADVPDSPYRHSFEGYCHHGLNGSGTPAIDLQRLGALCGPTTGLAPYGPAQLMGPHVARVGVQVDEHECVRVFVATKSGEELELELVAKEQVLQRCTISGLGMCPPDVPLCLVSRDFGPERFGLDAIATAPPEGEVLVRFWHRLVE